MSRHSFIQLQKLTDVKGRIDYISSPDRQENLYATYQTSELDFWNKLSEESQRKFNESGTDGKCVEARELIIALPEQFLNYRPRKVVEVFTENFKKRHQVECTSALHHNAERTNYHIHLIFSESGLEETYFGLLFLTPENLESRWIYYEAGALSKGKNDSHVIPMLYQLEAGKLQEPLSAFHAMSLEKHDMLKVVKTINKKMAEVTEESLLEEIFENWWEKWEAEADKFPADIKEIEESIKLTDAPQMNIQEQIEEVLTRLRRQDGKEGVSKIPRLNEMDNDIFKMQELEDFSNVIREADFLDSEQKRTVITKMYNKMIDL